jgi:predicted alpha-1,2-mannosidase
VRRVLLACLAALCALAPAAPAAERDLASWVDPMIGTLPPGFVFPGAAVPYGMVQNSPDTMGEFAYSGYLASDPTIRGFSLVHLSGPGVKKGGDIPLMPFVGEPSSDPNVYASTYDHALERAEAGYYRVFLHGPATTAELTASTRAAMQRYTFPAAPRAGLILDVGRSVEGVHEGHFEVTGPDEVSGWARGRYPVHFVARFSRPFDASGAFRSEGKGAAGWVAWDTTGEQAVTVRIGISFVDREGARRNLEAEAPGFDFDAMRSAARARWNEALASVRVEGGSDAERTSFYTALYHAQLHPNVFTDVDGRYLGADGQPHVADGRTQYANFSLWDTYKAQNQLLATIAPDRYRDMLLSLLAVHREGGKLPRWGEHNIDPAHMSGDPAIQTIADGVCRGVLGRTDAEALYRAAVALLGHREPELAELGYLPLERSSRGAGTTLEYGVADFALALVADALGEREDAARWREASLRYRLLVDPETRFVRPRHADGSWHEPFSTTDEEGFQEGNSWQYSWLAPHDARGLFDAMGGDEVARERLDRFFSLHPEVQNRLTLFGLVYRTDQYAPGNEHDIQAPWMYAFAGQPWKTARELRQQDVLFRPTMDGLPGNDDLGGLSAWYVWSALGLGPVTPGAPLLVLGVPQFPRAVVTAPGERTFAIEAPGARGGVGYVFAARLDGRPLERAWLYDAELRDGSTLALRVASRPSPAFGADPAVRPPSASDSPLERFGCRDALPPAPLRASVAPRRVAAGEPATLRFRVRSLEPGGARPARRALVRVAGRRARTGRDGRTALRVRFARPGVHRAVVSGPGMRRTVVRVRAVR